MSHGAGRNLTEAKNRISQLKADLTKLGPAPESMPEMIDTANLLRKNEYLAKADASKTELISQYDTYTTNLESLLSSVFEIQEQLKGILHDQSKLIQENPKKSPTKRRAIKQTKKQTKKRTTKRSS